MIYDFIMNDYEGNPVKLDKFKGKVLLIVNTATKCGFTKQYDELVELYEKHSEEGFEILDFPCNQFFKQAPGTSEEIHNECVLRFGISFPQFDKIDVNGANEHPLYKFLKEQTDGKRIRWNFTKFLVDRDGVVVNRYDSKVKPFEIEKDINKLL